MLAGMITKIPEHESWGKMKRKILVVDDDKLIHQIIKDALGEQYVTLEATNGEDALALAPKFMPDLIILDIEMPGISGIDVCKELKEASSTKDIPIILISSHTNEEEILTGLHVGADDYLTKPIYPPEVLSRVEAHVSHKDFYSDLERDDLQMLLEMNDSVSTLRNPMKILRVIVEKFASVIGVERCSIVGINHSGELIVKASSDLVENIEIKLDMSRYPEIRKAYETKRAVVVHDVQSDPLMAPARQYMVELGFNSIVVVPIMKKEIVIGTFFLGTATNLSEGVPDRIFKLCHLVANISASALENAALFESISSARDFFEGAAIRDGLTRLYNHCHFFDCLGREFSRSSRYREPLALIFFDIDDFKQVNDTFGHIRGDEVLRTIGAIIRRLVRENDIPARYGGEEFAILLPCTNAEGATKLAMRIAAEISAHRYEGLGEEKITVSTGITLYNGTNFKTADEFVQSADTLMYQAKHKGKNCIVLDPNYQDIPRVRGVA